MIAEKFLDRFAKNSGIKDKFIAEREVVHLSTPSFFRLFYASRRKICILLLHSINPST